MLFLLKVAGEQELNIRRFQAGLKGIDLDKALKEQEETEADGTPKLFKEAGHYDHLSEKERKELTKKMKARLQGMGVFKKTGIGRP